MRLSAKKKSNTRTARMLPSLFSNRLRDIPGASEPHTSISTSSCDYEAPPHLLKLPAELQVIIWDLALPSSNPVVCLPLPLGVPSTPYPMASLLLVNK